MGASDSAVVQKTHGEEALPIKVWKGHERGTTNWLLYPCHETESDEGCQDPATFQVPDPAVDIPNSTIFLSLHAVPLQRCKMQNFG